MFGFVAVALVIGASACEPESESADTAAPVFTTVPTTTIPPTTVPLTTSTTTVAVDLLGSCVEHAKFQAFTGNQFWASIWDDAGRTDDAMRATCRFLATDRPGWLDEIHAQWTSLQAAAGLTPTTVAP